MDYLVHVLIVIEIYVLLAISLDVIAGYTGIISVAHAACFGVGAYASALLALRLGWSFLGGLVGGAVGGAAVGLFLAVLGLRLRDDYLVVGTLGLQVVVSSALVNLTSLTGGPMGIRAIPAPSVFGVSLSPAPRFLLFVSCLCAAAGAFALYLVSSPLGRILKAIRDDDVFLTSAGKDPRFYKLLVLIIGGSFAGLAGVLYAYYFSYIDPTSFTVMESIFVLTVVIVGGAGSLLGPAVGASLLVLLPEFLRFVHFPDSLAANAREITYSLLLIGFVAFRPRGLMGKYRF